MKPLEPPAGVESDPNSMELLRLWAAHSKLNVSINIGVFSAKGHNESKAWGIVMSDFARHVAQALAQRDGKNEEQELARIRESFLREISEPTSEVTGE